MAWQLLGSAPPASLTATRLQLHYGAYVLASAAHALLEHAADDSHSNLGLDPAHRSLCTRDLRDGLALHLDLEDFALVARRGSDATDRLPLAGRTFADALAWATTATGAAAAISRREYPDFPDSPIMTGGAFSASDRRELAELGRWFENAHSLLEALRPDAPTITEARVWPHHFDLGALVPLSEDGQVTIGLGFSPGDAEFDQPYFYCSPYPPPSSDSPLPELPAGAWNTSFVSALLKADELLASEAQQETATRYWNGAVQRCRELLS